MFQTQIFFAPWTSKTEIRAQKGQHNVNASVHSYTTPTGRPTHTAHFVPSISLVTLFKQLI